MNRRSMVYSVLLVVLAPHVPTPTLAEPDNPDKYLDAVREFADNVLKYGRDTYGPKHTPLFVDGLNIHTHEPVKWISPKGGDPLTATETEEWILSNFASQQTLLRTLDGLSEITGDPKYRNAAEQSVRYACDNLRAANGLFYWGDCDAWYYESIYDYKPLWHLDSLLINIRDGSSEWQWNSRGYSTLRKAHQEASSPAIMLMDLLVPMLFGGF